MVKKTPNEASAKDVSQATPFVTQGLIHVMHLSGNGLFFWHHLRIHGCLTGCFGGIFEAHVQRHRHLTLFVAFKLNKKSAAQPKW